MSTHPGHLNDEHHRGKRWYYSNGDANLELNKTRDQYTIDDLRTAVQIGAQYFGNSDYVTLQHIDKHAANKDKIQTIWYGPLTNDDGTVDDDMGRGDGDFRLRGDVIYYNAGTHPTLDDPENGVGNRNTGDDAAQMHADIVGFHGGPLLKTIRWYTFYPGVPNGYAGVGIKFAILPGVTQIDQNAFANQANSVERFELPGFPADTSKMDPTAITDNAGTTVSMSSAAVTAFAGFWSNVAVVVQPPVIQSVDATAGETSTVVDNSVVVTRTIDVSADIASNIHLMVQPSTAAAPTASQVVASEALVASTTTATTATFSVPNLPSETAFTAYAVAAIDDGSTQSAVASHTFTTGDFTNPVASVTQGTVNIDSAQVNVTSSEAGTAYFRFTPDDGVLVVQGYYPLYATQEAAAAVAGATGTHTHTFDSVTYYMPEGVTIYHGNYAEGIKEANATTSITAAGTSFTHDLTGLASGTAYVVHVLVEDGASQPNASDIQSLTFTTATAASAHAASAKAAVDDMSVDTRNAVDGISAANITDQSSANTRSQSALDAISGDTFAFNAKSSAQKRELLRDVMKHAVTVATEGPAGVQKISVSGASFRAFVPDLAGDAGTALGLATTVDVVPPEATVTVGTAGTAVYCPLAVGESVTLTFEGTSVEWTKLSDGTTKPNTTFFGDAFLSWSGASSALQPGEQATLTASSLNKFHFFAGSVGGAGDGDNTGGTASGDNTGGTASGDPFVATFL